MRTFLLSDRLNQLHWMQFKSTLMILAILPISHGLLNLLTQAEGSSQIMIGFLSISLLSASCIIAFIFALQATTWQYDLAQSKTEQRLFKLYRQLPMTFFAAIMVFVVIEYL